MKFRVPAMIWHLSWLLCSFHPKACPRTLSILKNSSSFMASTDLLQNSWGIYAPSCYGYFVSGKNNICPPGGVLNHSSSLVSNAKFYFVSKHRSGNMNGLEKESVSIVWNSRLYFFAGTSFRLSSVHSWLLPKSFLFFNPYLFELWRTHSGICIPVLSNHSSTECSSIIQR